MNSELQKGYKSYKEICHEIAGRLNINNSDWSLHIRPAHGAIMELGDSWGRGFTVEQLKVLSVTCRDYVVGITSHAGRCHIHLCCGDLSI